MTLQYVKKLPNLAKHYKTTLDLKPTPPKGLLPDLPDPTRGISTLLTLNKQPNKITSHEQFLNFLFVFWQIFFQTGRCEIKFIFQNFVYVRRILFTGAIGCYELIIPDMASIIQGHWLMRVSMCELKTCFVWSKPVTLIIMVSQSIVFVFFLITYIT